MLDDMPPEFAAQLAKAEQEHLRQRAVDDEPLVTQGLLLASQPDELAASGDALVAKIYAALSRSPQAVPATDVFRAELERRGLSTDPPLDFWYMY